MYFYQLMKRIRISRHMTVKQLTGCLALSPSTYRNWESGRNIPSFYNLDILKTAFPDYADDIEASFREHKLIDPREVLEALRETWSKMNVSEPPENPS